MSEKSPELENWEKYYSLASTGTLALNPPLAHLNTLRKALAERYKARGLENSFCSLDNIMLFPLCDVAKELYSAIRDIAPHYTYTNLSRGTAVDIYTPINNFTKEVNMSSCGFDFEILDGDVEFRINDYSIEISCAYKPKTYFSNLYVMEMFFPAASYAVLCETLGVRADILSNTRFSILDTDYIISAYKLIGYLTLSVKRLSVNLFSSVIGMLKECFLFYDTDKKKWMYSYSNMLPWHEVSGNDISTIWPDISVFNGLGVYYYEASCRVSLEKGDDRNSFDVPIVHVMKCSYKDTFENGCAINSSIGIGCDIKITSVVERMPEYSEYGFINDFGPENSEVFELEKSFDAFEKDVVTFGNFNMPSGDGSSCKRKRSLFLSLHVDLKNPDGLEFIFSPA